MNNIRIIARILTVLYAGLAFWPDTNVCRADNPPATPASANIPAPFPGQPVFKQRGFYLHCGWAFDYPFAPRSWKRADFDNMFELLRRMGFETVMYWPQIEAIPAPLSEQDAAELRNIREIVGDARRNGLNCWLTLVPNLTSPPEIAKRPFAERNPYRSYQTVRLDDPKQAQAFLAHRTAMLRIVNNADAYVTIDGDPGGYAGAKPEDFLRVLLSDRAAIDAHGVAPRARWSSPGFGQAGEQKCRLGRMIPRLSPNPKWLSSSNVCPNRGRCCWEGAIATVGPTGASISRWARNLA